MLVPNYKYGEYIKGKNRGRLDIIADILQATGETKVKKTRIMLQANLSYKVLQRYLSYIVGASLLNFDKFENYFAITEKGRVFLQVYTEYLQSNDSVEKLVVELKSKQRFLEKLCADKVKCAEYHMQNKVTYFV